MNGRLVTNTVSIWLSRKLECMILVAHVSSHQSHPFMPVTFGVFMLEVWLFVAPAMIAVIATMTQLYNSQLWAQAGAPFCEAHSQPRLEILKLYHDVLSLGNTKSHCTHIALLLVRTSCPSATAKNGQNISTFDYHCTRAICYKHTC